MLGVRCSVFTKGIRSLVLFSALVLILPFFAAGQPAASPPEVSSPASPRLFSASGTYFEVVGVDQRSVSYVADLGTRLVQSLSRFLEKGGVMFPERIFVTLRPQDAVDFEGSHRIRFVERGGVYLDFHWEAGLELETVCHALTEAYLLRYAIFNYGPTAPEQFPTWVVSALGSQAYLSLRPAMYTAFIRDLERRATPDLAELLETRWPERGETANLSNLRDGFWVLVSMRQSGLDRRTITSVMEQAIAGANLHGRLQEMLQPMAPADPKVDLQDWWQMQRNAALAGHQEIREPMATSRQWLEALAGFEGVAVEDSTIKNMRGLWQHRNDPALRTVLTARRELLGLRMTRVNPAYFNAARSLGALMEVVLEADRMHEFVAALTTYLNDWEDAKRLESQIHQALAEGER